MTAGMADRLRAIADRVGSVEAADEGSVAFGPDEKQRLAARGGNRLFNGDVMAVRICSYLGRGDT